MMTIIYDNIEQSGTKPNLVAKILATKFGFVPDCRAAPEHTELTHWGIVTHNVA